MGFLDEIISEGIKDTKTAEFIEILLENKTVEYTPEGKVKIYTCREPRTILPTGEIKVSTWYG